LDFTERYLIFLEILQLKPSVLRQQDNLKINRCYFFEKFFEKILFFLQDQNMHQLFSDNVNNCIESHFSSDLLSP